MAYRNEKNQDLITYELFKKGGKITSKDVTRKFITYLMEDNDDVAKLVADEIKKMGGVEVYNGEEKRANYWKIKKAIIKKFIPYLSPTSPTGEKEDPFISAYNRFYNN